MKTIYDTSQKRQLPKKNPKKDYFYNFRYFDSNFGQVIFSYQKR